MPSFRAAHKTHLGLSQPHETLVESSNTWRLCRGAEQLWALRADEETLSLHYSAAPGVNHYFRRADATLIPLPVGRPQGSPLQFTAGDAYIAVSPGAARLAGSPAIARFIHLRDYFNAEKLAEALLAHLLELAGSDQIPDDLTVLVIEAR